MKIIKIHWSFYYKVEKHNVQKKFTEKILTQHHEISPLSLKSCMKYILSLVWKIAFFVQNFGLEYEHTPDWIIDCSKFKCTNNCWKLLIDQ